MTGSRGNWQGRSVLPGQYLRRQIAEHVGVHYDTVKRWQAEGLLKPISKHGTKRGQYIFDDIALRIATRLKELDCYNVDLRRIILDEEIARGEFD